VVSAGSPAPTLAPSTIRFSLEDLGRKRHLSQNDPDVLVVRLTGDRPLRDPMPDVTIETVIGWLIDGARSARRPQDVLSALCDQLLACGIPLWRVAVFVRTLHPDLMGRRFLWRHGEDVQVGEAANAVTQGPQFQDSPVARIYSTGRAIRRRLIETPGDDDFRILRELRADGVTDYLASPLHFSNGEVHVVTWTTRAAAGFADHEIRALESVVAPFARVAEVWAVRRMATNLLDTYVGNQTGARILAGQIRRGDTQAIHAAIWLSDMRGFTALADRLPADVLVDLLNRYFDCQVPAIVAHGGEVLKFMGDGLLAIFPVARDDGAVVAVCRDVLQAASKARANVAAMATPQADDGRRRFAIALHVGEVLYGNIGGANRLDFTCIGPAVNLAARIEKLAAGLGRTTLASGEFARHCGATLTPVGEFALRGFDAPQTVFGLADEATASTRSETTS
jgi:adenylate cyclase